MLLEAGQGQYRGARHQFPGVLCSGAIVVCLAERAGLYTIVFQGFLGKNEKENASYNGLNFTENESS